MVERTPEDVLAGVLRISVGGVEKLVPTLPIRAAREWHEANASRPGKGLLSPVNLEDWTPNDVSAYNTRSVEVVLDMLVEYDKTGALGGREWLEEHADPAQLRIAIDQVLAVLFPFADDAGPIRAVLVYRRVVGSGSPSSTNGHSPIGASIHARSKTDSTRRS